MSISHVKSPCKTCPFRTDVKPFLRLARAFEIANQALNKYANFLCHSTFKYDGEEDHQGRPTGDFSKARTCAGFLTLRAQEGGGVPDDFQPATDLCYDSIQAMIEAYGWGEDECG